MLTAASVRLAKDDELLGTKIVYMACNMYLVAETYQSNCYKKFRGGKKWQNVH
jgi:hypothetical protein